MDLFHLSSPGNVLADSIDNSITDDSLASLIRMPGGCVEQNLATITLPLIATLYLERTDGWESVGVQRKAEALRYIRRGERRQRTNRSLGGYMTAGIRQYPVTRTTTSPLGENKRCKSSVKYFKKFVAPCPKTSILQVKQKPSTVKEEICGREAVNLVNSVSVAKTLSQVR